MMSTDFVLVLLSFVCFVAAAVNVSSPKINLVAAGLALYIASILF